MPYLKIQTNQAIETATQVELMQQASQRVAEALSKPERYVMVALQPETPLLFAGNDAPAAYLELKSIGLPDEATASLSATLCGFVTEALEIPQERIYIEFANAARHLWGWDGRTF